MSIHCLLNCGLLCRNFIHRLIFGQLGNHRFLTIVQWGDDAGELIVSILLEEVLLSGHSKFFHLILLLCFVVAFHSVAQTIVTEYHPELLICVVLVTAEAYAHVASKGSTEQGAKPDHCIEEAPSDEPAALASCDLLISNFSCANDDPCDGVASVWEGLDRIYDNACIDQ